MKINTLSKPNNQDHRKATDSYYTSGQHKNLRTQAYIRDKGKCVVCGMALSLHTTREKLSLTAYADHITPREAGGKDELSNYQTMCKKHHDIKSNEDKKYYK